MAIFTVKAFFAGMVIKRNYILEKNPEEEFCHEQNRISCSDR